jgi:hypothetical protein
MHTDLIYNISTYFYGLHLCHQGEGSPQIKALLVLNQYLNLDKKKHIRKFYVMSFELFQIPLPVHKIPF